jgi:hypothetical protein
MVEDPLNKDCFFPPKAAGYEAAARGHAFDPATGALGPKNGGMTRMNRVHLAVGQPYFRFCDTAKYNTNWQRAAGGGWWAEFETFREIQDYARRTKSVKEYAGQQRQSAISYAAKLHFAIPYEWGDCGVIVMARLRRRLDAWKGWGDTALLARNAGARDPRDGGAKYIPLQKQEVFQLFIPEIWVHFDAAFIVERRGHAALFA